MDNNKTNPLAEIRRNILGFGIKNTFRSMQQYVEEVRDDRYIYTDNAEDMQSFLSVKEAKKALKEKRDSWYDLGNFEIVKLWQHLPEQVVVDAILTCLRNNGFKIDKSDNKKALSFRNNDNNISICFFEYNSDKTEEANYSSREVAEESGCITLEDGFIFIDVHDDYEDFAITRTDDLERFDELEKEVVKLVKATFNVK